MVPFWVLSDPKGILFLGLRGVEADAPHRTNMAALNAEQTAPDPVLVELKNLILGAE